LTDRNDTHAAIYESWLAQKVSNAPSASQFVLSKHGESNVDMRRQWN